jgi:hypothetical protein
VRPLTNVRSAGGIIFADLQASTLTGRSGRWTTGRLIVFPDGRVFVQNNDVHGDHSVDEFLFSGTTKRPAASARAQSSLGNRNTADIHAVIDARWSRVHLQRQLPLRPIKRRRNPPAEAHGQHVLNIRGRQRQVGPGGKDPRACH